MLFNSIAFGLFFALVLPLYWSLRGRARTYFLLGASYFFYGSWDYRFLSLIALSTVVDYGVARAIAGTDDERKRRRLLYLSLGTNLGILGFFKYAGFFVDSMRELLTRLGMSTDTTTLDIILPVGISFYTFQTLSYTIDVYRREQEPTRDFIGFATYVAFFPQLVAGPIERFERLFPQLVKPRSVNVPFLREGVFLMLQGFVKKVAIADNLAPVVDRVFSDPAAHSAGELAEAAVMFTAQIYCDFSGYSDIARGVAFLLGVQLMVNFRAPLLSQSITEFWRRWHISLSSWLRDYLYIPLGGNRSGRARTYANLMATMLLGGLWHGAAWKFVAWGGLHGGLLALERALGLGTPDTRPAPGVRGLATAGVRIAICFATVVLIFIFFRAADIDIAWQMLAGIAGGQGLDALFTNRLGFALAAILALDCAVLLTDRQSWILETPLAFRVSAYVLMLLSIVVLSGHYDTPFIYFAF